MRKIVAILVIFLIGMYMGGHFFQKVERQTQTVIVHDTVTKAILRTIVKRDTVIK